MAITLGYSKQSAPSALKIADASDGRIVAVHGGGQINWGRRISTGAVLNPDNTNACNKRLMRELFAEAGVPAPKLFKPEEAQEAMEHFSLIGRPDFHTRGRGFWPCGSMSDVAKALRGTRRKMAATHFVEHVVVDHEFRVHIFNGQSIRISEKKFEQTEEGYDYTTIKPTLERKAHIREAAKAAVAAIGLNFGAVDILADAEHAYVLEVNSAPGLGGTMPKLYADTFIKWFNEREEA